MMVATLKKRHALVTGAAGGIGAAIARRLADDETTAGPPSLHGEGGMDIAAVGGWTGTRERSAGATRVAWRNA